MCRLIFINLEVLLFPFVLAEIISEPNEDSQAAAQKAITAALPSLSLRDCSEVNKVVFCLYESPELPPSHTQL